MQGFGIRIREKWDFETLEQIMGDQGWEIWGVSMAVIYRRWQQYRIAGGQGKIRPSRRAKIFFKKN